MKLSNIISGTYSVRSLEHEGVQYGYHPLKALAKKTLQLPPNATITFNTVEHYEVYEVIVTAGSYTEITNGTIIGNDLPAMDITAGEDGCTIILLLSRVFIENLKEVIL